MTMKDTVTVLPKSIWQELDDWAKGFEPYRRFVLATAIRFGRLTKAQVDEAYALLLHDFSLGDAPDPAIEVPTTITGRPASTALAPLWLLRINNLCSINALPPKAELSFSRQLTIIYGGNGVGKSGFARLLSNVCFSRTQHPILANIYETGAKQQSSADITIVDDRSVEKTLTFDGKTEHLDLRRIAVFDTAVARMHLVDQSPLGFTPAGFDVFPEMARVSTLLTEKLTADTSARATENKFINSFVSPESEVSKFVTALSADTDIPKLRGFATYGETEAARLEEVQRQIFELQSESVAGAIKQLDDARHDILSLLVRLTDILALLNESNRTIYRSQLADFRAKAGIVTERGAASFNQDFLKSIGSSQWETFLTAAYALAKAEHPDYTINTLTFST